MAIDREGSNRWRVVVRKKDGTMVHTSPWMTKKSAEHAAVNHRAMNRDIGLGYTTEIEEYSAGKPTTEPGRLRELYESNAPKRGHLSKPTISPRKAAEMRHVNARRLARLRVNGEDKRKTSAWRDAIYETSWIEKEISRSRQNARRGHMSKSGQGTLVDTIRPGSRVTIVNRFGQQSTGRAVMRGSYGWVLNMGGRHGTPGIATADNVVKVRS